MQGTISQILGLVITGNAALRGMAIGPFWPEVGIFQFCREVRFGVHGGGEGEGVTGVARDPDAWLAWLRECGVTALRAQCVPDDPSGRSDRNTTGFIGGGSRWFIESVEADGSGRLWASDWRTGDREAADRRIWHVSYLRHPTPAPVFQEPSLQRVTADLSETLAAMIDFAERSGAGAGFRGHFQRSLDALNGKPTANHSGYTPAPLALTGALPPEAERVLLACQYGWVFGGMGSWNDGAYPADHAAEGDPLSDRLFLLLQHGARIAANRSQRPPRAG